MSGPPRPARPGDLGDVERAALVEMAAAARRSHDWGPLSERLVRLRAWGVPVAALSAVVGVGDSRLRRLCRDHGPDPATVGDPLAEADGGAVMVGWTRLWHGPSLSGWWAVQRVDVGTTARVRRDARARRVRALVAGGATVVAAAAEVGVEKSSAYRYMHLGRRQR